LPARQAIDDRLAERLNRIVEARDDEEAKSIFQRLWA
jgi:hypothetical protein